ncbi:MAG: PD40 domain-containing protein [Bacteroidales bacterium]|nr:PD40 domain-containing protein [Bacteroidales bacterium]
MKPWITYLSLLLLILTEGFFCNVNAQNYHTTSGRALKLFNEGKRAYDYLDYRNAEKSLKEAIEVDGGFYEAYITLAEMFYDLKRFEEAITNYRKAIEIDSDYFKPAWYYLGVSEFNCGRYDSALASLKKFLATGDGTDRLKADALKKIRNSEYSLVAIGNPVPFNPVNIGDSVNSRFNDYSPTVTADGNVLMFTRELESGGNEMFSGRKQEDFYVSYRKSEGIWSMAINAGPPLNTPGNEGAQTIGAGGQYMYFTACDRPDGMGRCDIYYSSFDGKKWSDPVNIGGPINTPFWESQPSIGADGRTIYFVSNRPGGSGGLDIWISRMNDEGGWNDPVNAGETINTSGDDATPFIHFDGKTLYFSSNGRPNLGGYDLYMSRLATNNQWSEPINLGYPINTHNDEMGLAIESNGYRAYYASTSTRSRQKDIFFFDLHEEVRPDKVSYLKGRVFDYDTRRTLRARFELTNLTTGKPVASSFTSEDGQFLVCLPSGSDYGLNVLAEGYLFYSQNFPFEGEYSEYEPLVKDILLTLIRPGEKLILYNILFNINSSELLPNSIAELDKLYQLLIGNPGIKVEIGGHTDDTGSDELNLRLSEERANAVVRYLADRGIDRTRLTFKGYGKSLPGFDNSTAEGRRLNRRTEVKIVDILK